MPVFRQPYLLISDSALEDFKNLRYPDEECDSVVVGLAPERLSYENGLNTAFRICPCIRLPLTTSSTAEHMSFLPVIIISVSREPVTGSSPRPDPAAPRTLIATVSDLSLLPRRHLLTPGPPHSIKRPTSDLAPAPSP